MNYDKGGNSALLAVVTAEAEGRCIAIAGPKARITKAYDLAAELLPQIQSIILIRYLWHSPSLAILVGEPKINAKPAPSLRKTPPHPTSAASTQCQQDQRNQQF